MKLTAMKALTAMFNAAKKAYLMKHEEFAKTLAYTSEVPDGFHVMDIHKQARRLMAESHELDTLVSKLLLRQIIFLEDVLAEQNFELDCLTAKLRQVEITADATPKDKRRVA